MSIVDFQAVGEHAATLQQHAKDSEVWTHAKTLGDMARAGAPKYGPDDDLLEVCKLRSVAYRLKTEALNYSSVADRILAMVGEHPDVDYDTFVAGGAATDDEPTPSGGMPLKDAYKHAAKDSPPHTPGTPPDPGASDGAVARDWLASLPRAKSGSDKITTLAPGRTPMDKLLGRFK